MGRMLFWNFLTLLKTVSPDARQPHKLQIAVPSRSSGSRLARSISKLLRLCLCAVELSGCLAPMTLVRGVLRYDRPSTDMLIQSSSVRDTHWPSLRPMAVRFCGNGDALAGKNFTSHEELNQGR
jgi:hypothetical protein